jgi:hypothetical protein
MLTIIRRTRRTLARPFLALLYFVCPWREPMPASYPDTEAARKRWAQWKAEQRTALLGSSGAGSRSASQDTACIVAAVTTFSSLNS